MYVCSTFDDICFVCGWNRVTRILFAALVFLWISNVKRSQRFALGDWEKKRFFFISFCVSDMMYWWCVSCLWWWWLCALFLDDYKRVCCCFILCLFVHQKNNNGISIHSLDIITDYYFFQLNILNDI